VTPASDRNDTGTARATPADPRRKKLADALRRLASTAAEQAGGGLSLVFATTPSDESAAGSARLRAAAGFGTPQAARDAAEMLLQDVHNAIASHSREALPALPSLGQRAEHGIEIHPLTFENRIHGALVLGFPSSPDASARSALGATIDEMSLWLDHSGLSVGHDRSVAAASASPGHSDDQSEEILKLSEALFAQDIELLRSNEKIGKIEKLQTLRSALDEGSAFLRTLQNILDLWRIKQNELPVEIHDMNFRETVEEAIFSIQDAIGDKPIAVEQHIAEPFPKIRTDLTKVNQILFLLLDNAAKFTPEGRIEIRASIENDELQCEIRDTGIGICPDDQQFIFDEFFQVDVASSQTYTGAGLGLALVRDMITLLDGELAVASDVGRGTAVTFRIPVQVIG
jgi:signal transduction histidine kinase